MDACTVYLVRTTGVYTPPWGSFFSLVKLDWCVDNQERGCQDRTVDLWKALGEMFPAPTYFSGIDTILILFQLWRYRPWKIGPRVCDIHRRQTYLFRRRRFAQIYRWLGNGLLIRDLQTRPILVNFARKKKLVRRKQESRAFSPRFHPFFCVVWAKWRRSLPARTFFRGCYYVA